MSYPDMSEKKERRRHRLSTGIFRQPVEEPKGVPPGCVEIPGFILDVFDGSAWMTADGKVTDVFAERGIWPTQEEAAEAMKRFLAE